MKMEFHEVITPQPKACLQEFRDRVKEIFFPDDPLRQFNGQPTFMKWLLAIHYIFPILQWGPTYPFDLFNSYTVSGITIASLAIPQVHSSVVPPLVYAVLGSSTHLAVGPGSIASLILGSMLSQEVLPVTQPILYLQLAFTATFFAGVFQASLGVLRLGFIVDFLSRATCVGFMAGAAIIISLQQLKCLLGIKHFTHSMGLVPVMSSVFHRRDEWAWETIPMGICFLGLLLITRHIGMSKAKLFWVSAAAPLASVIISTLLVFALKAQNHKISVIGRLEEGLNPLSWNMLTFDSIYSGLVVKTGAMTGIISLTEGVAVGRTFAALKSYQVDGNKEMLAIGFMNVAGSCTFCYVTSGSFSRTAVNHNAGSKTAVSNIVMATTVMVTLRLVMPLFFYTPNVVLGAIIITSVAGLMYFPASIAIWKVDKVDFLGCLSAFLGVIFISSSVLKVLLQITMPKTALLGNLPEPKICASSDNIKAEMGRIIHAQVIRCIIYAILSIRLNLSYAFGLVNRCQGNLGIAHWQSIKMIL
ncbi:hypothetical protein AMTRI_Chr04g250940 [Amborella trichopoda]